MSLSIAPDSTVNPDEVAYFERLAHRWWDAEGPFWPLHRLNGFRLDYIRSRVAGALGRDPSGTYARSRACGCSTSAAAAAS